MAIPSSMSQASQNFTNFPELPAELRVKIWQMAMPDARTVVVKSPYSRHAEEEEPCSPSLEGAIIPQRDSEQTWYSNTQIPSLLHVNAEARYEALKHYKLSLAVGDAQPRIYVDFKRDTLFFGHSELKPECSSLWADTEDLESIQRLAVVPEGSWRILRWKKVVLEALEKIIFVYDTEKLMLGPTPQLVEDWPQEEQDELLQRIEAAASEETKAEQAADLDPMEALKKRRESAQEEIETVLSILPTPQPEVKPEISTAVFRKTDSDRWVAGSEGIRTSS